MYQLHLFNLIIPFNYQKPIYDGFILINKKNGRIIKIGSQNDVFFVNTSFGCEIKQNKNSICLAGFINNHIHLAYKNNYVIAKPNEQIEWLKNLVKTSRNWSEAEKQEIIKNNIQNCLKNGITFIFENTPFGKITATEIEKSPYKNNSLIGLEVFGNSEEQAELIFEKSVNYLNQLEAQFTDLKFTLSPHAIYSVGSSLLKKLMQWANTNNKILALHLAEFNFELELLQKNYLNPNLKEFFEFLEVSSPEMKNNSSQGTMQYLLNLATELKNTDLLKNFLLIHFILTSASDLEIAQKFGLGIVSCPQSNLFLQNGLPDYKNWLKYNLPFGFGTDSLASNFDFDFLSQLKNIYWLSNCQLSAQDLFEKVTSIPAKQLKLENEIGSLEENKKANFIHFELKPENLNKIKSLSEQDLYTWLLMNLNTNLIKQVFVENKPII